LDRFEAMSMLLEVVDRGNLSAASRSLKIPLPTLSRKITDLETLLGTKLLTRTTRRIALTDAGTTYVDAARRILEQVEEAERQASGEFAMPKGELVITAPVQFGRLHVLPVVTDFLATFPSVRFAGSSAAVRPSLPAAVCRRSQPIFWACPASASRS
jgi:DNA-binding transcriptional LysR family regulator